MSKQKGREQYEKKRNSQDKSDKMVSAVTLISYDFTHIHDESN